MLKNIELTDINNTMIRQFPARLKPQDAERTALFRAEVTESCIGHMISL